MTQMYRQHLHTMVITQLVGYLMFCRWGCVSRCGGRTPSVPWPPRSPRWSLCSWYSVMRQGSQVFYDFCFQGMQRRHPSSQPASHQRIQSQSSALTRPCLLPPFSGAIDLHSTSFCNGTSWEVLTWLQAGVQGAKQLRADWGVCQEVSGPDVKAEGKLVSLFPIPALENSEEGQGNPHWGCALLEVNVKVYLNPCAGVHSSPNYKDL